MFFSGNSSKCEGVAILIQPNCNVEIIDSVQIMEDRILALNVIIGGKQITLVNIYGPNKDDVTVFDNLNILLNSCNNQVNIGGDLKLF